MLHDVHVTVDLQVLTLLTHVAGVWKSRHASFLISSGVSITFLCWANQSISAAHVLSFFERPYSDVLPGGDREIELSWSRMLFPEDFWSPVG